MVELIKKNRLAQRDYGYINARVRAMSSALMRREEYQKLLELDDIKAICSSLASSDYAFDLKVAEEKYGAFLEQIEVYEKALEENFLRLLEKLRSMLDGEALVLFNLLLEKWDVQNIKTILRYKHVHADPSLILKDLACPGNLTRQVLEKLANAEDTATVIEQLIAWGIEYASPLKEVYEKVAGAQRYLLLECSLDKTYYAQLLKRTDKGRKNYALVAKAVRDEIDMSNVMIGLRLVRAGVSAQDCEPYFIPGGHRIKAEQFDALVKSANLKEAFDCLRRFSFQQVLDSRWDLYEKIKDLSVFERSLDEQITRRLYREFRRDMLGFGVILGYLRLKATEIVNLRIIGRAKEFGMPEEITRGELILIQ